MYENLIARLKKKNHLVIVIAEGAYKGLITECKFKIDERIKEKKYKLMINEDGNIDFASFLKADIGNYASEHHKFNCDCCRDLK